MIKNYLEVLACLGVSYVVYLLLVQVGLVSIGG